MLVIISTESGGRQTKPTKDVMNRHESRSKFPFSVLDPYYKFGVTDNSVCRNEK